MTIKGVAVVIFGIIIVGSLGYFYTRKPNITTSPLVANSSASSSAIIERSSSTPIITIPPGAPSVTSVTNITSSLSIVATTSSTAAPASSANTQLLALASNNYASGEVPLGDERYVTAAPKKGYVYLCNVHTDNFGSQVNGPWIGTSTWNFKNKTIVQGSVSWPQAQFSNTVSGTTRTLAGNGLPMGYTTGVYPIQSSDPAYKIDPNPNTITAIPFSVQLAANPVYSDTPYCTGGGEVGVMLSGVPLFNAFDAELRDAPAHEVQDSCDGHPDESGQYHYHSLSSCFKDTNVSTVLGYALDGFPITGPTVSSGSYLTTADLDECHGITSDVNVDGKMVSTYHYVMTYDFPYSLSCFHGKPLQITPTGSGTSVGAQGGTGGQTPPAAATAACSGKTSGASCSFTMPNGSISGTCKIPPGQSLACVP